MLRVSKLHAEYFSALSAREAVKYK